MYSLLLVDDEAVILNGLYQNVDWFSLGIDQVYQARNAKTALEILSKNRIDVVVTDIYMPEFDGLQMSQKILFQWPMVKIILLSGYREFRYAQKAVQLGVYRYLSKPVSYAEMAEAVAGALRKLEEELNQQKVLRQAEQKIHKTSLLLQERALNAWITRGIRVGQETFSLCGLPADLEAEGFLLVLRKDDSSDRVGAYGLLSLSFPALLKGIINQELELYTFADGGDNLVALVSCEEKTRLEDFYEQLKSVLDAVQRSIQKTLGFTVSIYWSELLPLKELPPCYQRIVSRMHRNPRSAEGALIGPEAMFEEHPAVLESLTLYPDFFSLVELQQERQAVERIRRIFGEIREKKIFGCEVVQSVYQIVVGALQWDALKRNCGEEWRRGLDSFFSGSFACEPLDKLEESCVTAVTRYMEFVRGHELRSAARLADEIKGYIGERVSRSLSVTEIAERFSYNPSYLTRIFKKETGTSLNEYIIHVRMEKARELLRRPGARVAEVSAQVGYNSVPHFSRLFKQLYGISPKQMQAG